MFATLTDIYIRFGKENVLPTGNFDADDPYDPAGVERIEVRINYFLRQAYEIICDALRQGAYEADTIPEPYPQTLVNLNCEVAYINMYRAKHSNDETTPDAYSLLENNAYRLIRNIQGGAVRFNKSIKRAMSVPCNVDASVVKSGNKKTGGGTVACNHRPMTAEEVTEMFEQIFYP
jgi:hypothetical protein